MIFRELLLKSAHIAWVGHEETLEFNDANLVCHALKARSTLYNDNKIMEA